MNQLEKLYSYYMIAIGFFGQFIFVFQTIKIIQTGSARDISLGGFIVSFISLISWLIYGILKKDRPLIVVNLFASIAAFICICAILMFR